MSTASTAKIIKIQSTDEPGKNESGKSYMPQIQNGQILSVSYDKIIVDISGEKIEAKKAFSCFTVPRPKDRVILVKDETGLFYILGIIERKEKQKVTIAYPSDADIKSENGNLNLRSKQSLAISSENLNFFSKKAIHKSREAIVSFDDTTANGITLQASFKTIRLISRLINTMAKQVIESFTGYIRNTEANDQVKAGQMNRIVDEMYSMDSKYTVMVSKKDTKIDGERIHMG
ncbi:MAG: DUF3540 domain-containing protein [Thermodesulfobacteriota bacterium]|nr:DUF3540 domain-containing protein [Thermodesulfobacteriota bacterium]